LKFGDKRTPVLFSALLLIYYLSMGFSNQTLRHNVKDLLPKYESDQMSYDLRRLKLKGLNSYKAFNRYYLNSFGLRAVYFFTKTKNHIFSKAVIPSENIDKPRELGKSI